MPRLPLFPLRVVLFPGMLLPLHIFEERYQEMVNHCLEEKSSFGVVLIRSGEEVGGMAIPYTVGTTAHIIEMERLKDGHMNILALGRQRFRVQQIVQHEPYLVGEIQFYPLRGGEVQETHGLARRVHELLDVYIDLLRRAAGVDLHLEHPPDSPAALAIVVALALQISLEEKQKMLEAPSYGQMLSLEEAFLRREEAILTYVLRTQEPPGDEWPYIPSFTPN